MSDVTVLGESRCEEHPTSKEGVYTRALDGLAVGAADHRYISIHFLSMHWF